MILIGFDVGGTNIKAGILDEQRDPVARSEASFPKQLNYHNIINIMHDMAIKLLAENNFDKSSVESVGIASAGAVDVSEGVILHAYNLDFHGVPIKKEMEQFFPGVLVKLINDANAATLAEHRMGALKGYKNAVLMTLGTGVGGGAILDGKLFNGGMGHGVELGHMTLSLDGPMCTCGNKGCIETLCSATWIAKQGRGDAKTVIDGAKKGDAASMEIFKEYIENLSSAIASITSLLDPEIIALGGGVSHAGDFLFEALRDKVEKKSFFKYPYKIVPARLGNDAGWIGAAIF